MHQRRSIHPFLDSKSLDMPTPLSPNKSSAVKAMLALSMNYDVIATKAKCSTRAVRRIEANLASFGTMRRPQVVKQGRPSNLTPKIEIVLTYIWYPELTNCRASCISSNIDVLDILTKWSISFEMNMVWWLLYPLFNAFLSEKSGIKRRYLSYE